MNKNELGIVFMGTPAFAVESLRALVEGGYKVVGVVTMPDKPAGRGHKLQCSPVKLYALEQGLTLLQPERLKDEDFIRQLRELNADLQVVVAFRMLPEVVWNMPRFGTFNLHASLLPQYRGAAPINWAIIRGEKVTGATTFFLTHEIDTGKVILQKKIDIAENDTAGIVHDKLMTMGAGMVVETVNRVLQGKLDAIEQEYLINENEPLRSAPKIFKETCGIKPEMGVKDAHNLVRGLSPYPAAWVAVTLPGQTEPLVLKVFDSLAEPESDTLYQPGLSEVNAQKMIPGTFVTDGKKKAGIVLSDGILWFRSVQPPAKKRMPVDEWLRGLRT